MEKAKKQNIISFFCRIIAIIFVVLAAIILVVNMSMNGRYICHSIVGNSLPNSITENISLSKQDNYRLSLVYLDRDNDILSNRINQINNDIYTAKHFHGKAIISKKKILNQLHEIIISSKYYNYSYDDFHFNLIFSMSLVILFLIIAIISKIISQNLCNKAFYEEYKLEVATRHENQQI